MSDAVRAEKPKIELATEHLVKTSSFPLMLLHIFLKKEFSQNIFSIFSRRGSLNSWIWDIVEVREVRCIKSFFSMRMLMRILILLHFDAELHTGSLGRTKVTIRFKEIVHVKVSSPTKWIPTEPLRVFSFLLSVLSGLGWWLKDEQIANRFEPLKNVCLDERSRAFF